MKHQDLRKVVARIARRMISSGLVTGTEGNVSARTPEGDVLITPSGLEYGQLEPEDVVLVDLDKNLLEGSLEPSSETPMHTGIYRARPEVGAVVHTHSRYATTLACLGWEIPPVHYMLTTISDDGRIPLASYATYGTEELAGYASDALGESHNACLLQNHGTITVGESPEEAFSRTVVLEEMAQIYYQTRLAGEPILLDPKQVAEVAAKIADYGQAKARPPRRSSSVCAHHQAARKEHTFSGSKFARPYLTLVWQSRIRIRGAPAGRGWPRPYCHQRDKAADITPPGPARTPQPKP